MRLAKFPLLMIIGLVSAKIFAAPASPADLAAVVDLAIQARDINALVRLVHTEGMSDEDLQQAHSGFAGALPEEGIVAEVTVDRLPDIADISKPRIYFGKRITLTGKPVGIIRISSQKGRAQMQATIPYVQASDGGYLLAGRITTDLGWTGPKDKQLCVNFAGDYPRDGCVVTFKFNASGVDLTDSFKAGSCIVLGQHIDEVVITGLPSDFQGQLVLMENGVEYFRSEPITDKSTYTYRRKVE